MSSDGVVGRGPGRPREMRHRVGRRSSVDASDAFVGLQFPRPRLGRKVKGEPVVFHTCEDAPLEVVEGLLASHGYRPTSGVVRGRYYAVLPNDRGAVVSWLEP